MLPIEFAESAEKCFDFSVLFEREIALSPFFICRKILMKTLYDKLLVLRDAGLPSGEQDRMATSLTVRYSAVMRSASGILEIARMPESAKPDSQSDHGSLLSSHAAEAGAAIRTGGDGQPVAGLADAKRRSRSCDSSGLFHSEGKSRRLPDPVYQRAL
jgi:hypothetical protein